LGIYSGFKGFNGVGVPYGELVFLKKKVSRKKGYSIIALGVI